MSVQNEQWLGIAQLVARYLGVVEAVGSNPATQTKNSGAFGYCCFFFTGFEGEAVLNGLPVDDQIRRLTEDRSPRTNPATQTKQKSRALCSAFLLAFECGFNTRHIAQKAHPL